MTFNPDIHHRRSIRLKEYDYSSVGAYFVTACTQERLCLLGDIADGVVCLNDAGRMVADRWLKLPDRFPGVAVDEYVVMPNHFHGIIMIVGAPLAAPESTPLAAPESTPLAAPESTPLAAPELPAPNVCDMPASDILTKNRGAASSAPTLGNIMRAFKSLTALEINRLLDRSGIPVWQRNYYERVIRDDAELNGIREYIKSNPVNWANDEEYR